MTGAPPEDVLVSAFGCLRDVTVAHAASREVGRASECCRCRARGPIGLTTPASLSTFPSELAVSTRHRPPTVADRVHPPVRFAPLQSSVRPLPSRAHRAQDRLSWGSRFPLRDLGLHRLATSSQPRCHPSTAFRTPSTFLTDAGFAGLFHPAAASRVPCPSGVSPLAQPHRLVAGPCPLVVDQARLSLRLRTTTPASPAPPSGLCSVRESVVISSVLPAAMLAPLVGLSSSRSSFSPPRERLHIPVRSWPWPLGRPSAC